MNALIAEIEIPTLVAEGTRVTGSIVFQGTGEIHGLVEGEIVQQSLEPIKVGRGGWVHGTIVSQGPVVIAGKVEGGITSGTLIHLLPSAQVFGALTSPSVKVENGAMVEGELKMKSANSRVSLRSAA